MALVLKAGAANNVFEEDFAQIVDATIERHLGFQLTSSPDNGAFHSQELGWSWWRQLQESALAILSESTVPNLLAMPAWHGVYLPAATEIRSFSFKNYSTQLDVASAVGLAEELARYGAARELPTVQENLQSLIESYQDDDRIDDDPEVQMYANLLYFSQLAIPNRMGLWVVK